MLFNSPVFICVYLPATLLLFFLSAQINHRLAAAGLAAASIVFYGYWRIENVLLLLTSIVFNYAIGLLIGRSRYAGSWRATRCWLACGIVGDLLLLGYYKYYDFFLGSIAAVVGADWNSVPLVLPLGISFFTFTQIAFLVDTAQGKAQEYNPIHYVLFVTFFPHLIAGPILHHKEMMPQFDRRETYRISAENLAVGCTIFIIGLFKKTVLADDVAGIAHRIFETSAGTSFTMVEAWVGTLAYSLQLYFDFSGYSDMAIGLSRLFGIKLPINFNSPYKADSIIDFWRRWHMTLSRFLRDYLYIPLGGNRFGGARRYLNLMISMALGGLWHGAGWTFVVWGCLHGGFLVINHGWRYVGGDAVVARVLGPLRQPAYRLLTFGCVCVGWVFFRATDMSQALAIVRGMAGLNGWLGQFSLIGYHDGVWIPPLLMIVWLLPNAYEFMARVDPALVSGGALRSGRLVWRPSVSMALLIGVLGFACIPVLRRVAPFLYFQF